MKEEARFQIRGEVTKLSDESYKESVRVSMILRVATGQDRNAHLKITVWDEELCRVARACKGRHVLVVGRLTGGASQAGYYNAYLSADAILVEPAVAPAGGYGVASPAAARGASPHQVQHQQAKENGCQPQADDPLPWEENLSKDDIPF